VQAEAATMGTLGFDAQSATTAHDVHLGTGKEPALRLVG
jgi:hypothetical protein